MKNLVIAIILAILVSGCAREEVDYVSVWHWMTDRADAFDELAIQYRDKTGVEVRFELYAPSPSYSERIRAAAQTDNLPDIFGVLGEKRDLASFINAGHVANLSGYMEKPDSTGLSWRDTLFPAALEINKFREVNVYEVKEGIYGAPIDIMNIPMLYNKRLFERAGLDPERPPLTWDEFIEYGQKLKQAGINVFSSGFGETWLIESLAYNYAFNIMGEEKVLDTFRGDVPYSDIGWVHTFTIFEDMKKHNLITEDSVTMINRLAEQQFATERVAFSFNGSWCVNVYRGMNPDLEYSTMLPPKYSDEHNMVIWGGAGSSFLVNARAARKDEAVEFLRWLTADEQQAFLSEETRNLPSNKDSLDLIEEEILIDFSQRMQHITHPNVWPVTEEHDIREAMNRGIQQILIGERTPEELANRLERLKN